MIGLSRRYFVVATTTSVLVVRTIAASFWICGRLTVGTTKTPTIRTVITHVHSLNSLERKGRRQQQRLFSTSRIQRLVVPWNIRNNTIRHNNHSTNNNGPIMTDIHTITSPTSMMPSITNQKEPQNPYWTVCPKCYGEGKLFKTPSRKARLRYKRTKINPQNETDNGCDDDGTAATTTTTTTTTIVTASRGIIPPNQRIDPCPTCHQSGLLPSSTKPIIRNDQFPHIIIVGGGLGGLACHVACSQRGISSQVMERDDNFLQRSQGYGLTMQQASKALKGFGIPTLSSGITSTKHVVHLPNGTVVGEWGLRKWKGIVENEDVGSNNKNSNKRQNIHVARQALRQELLTQALIHNADGIYWNHKLLEYHSLEDGRLDLVFQVGDETKHYQADLIVGADGIRSTVRQQTIGENVTPLRYLDCLVILGICPLNRLTNTHPLLDGETVFQTADGTTRIYVMPYSQTECMWQLSFPMSEDDANDVSRQGPACLKQTAINKCHTWHDPIPDVLQHTPTELISGYPVYDRELLTLDRLTSQGNAAVTLLGDAAHPMSPFKGQGANQALLDALSLARSIYKTFSSPCRLEDTTNANINTNANTNAHTNTNPRQVLLQKALTEYHEEMIGRSAVKVQASALAAQFLHTDIAIQRGNVTRGAAAAAAAAATASTQEIESVFSNQTIDQGNECTSDRQPSIVESNGKTNG